MFPWGIALFALSSLACGLAPSPAAPYGARAAQGASAAFLLAPALAIIGHTFHDEHARGRAWAVWGGIMGLTMVLSPLLGGVINSLLGWRWAFHINVPICAVLGTAVLRRVDESRDPTPRPLDFAGIALFASAMFALTWTLILGPGHGWGSGAVLGRAAVGLMLFAAFCLVERALPHPMLDLALFKAWPFVGAVIAMFAYASSAQVMASVLPLFLQNGRGDTALMAYAALQAGPAMVIVGMALLGTGGGLLNGETQKAIMGNVPPHRAGMASGISTTARFSGILLGFAGLGAVLASNTGTAIRSAAQAAHLQVDEVFIGRVVAGDIQDAIAAYPSSAWDALTAIARAAYGAGFSGAFHLAATSAGICALLVFLSMRRSGKRATLVR